jgi:rhamnose utilization protein RhaD (predicted bifunctional aldolase and dehydrogenase)
MCIHIIHVGGDMGNITLSVPEDLLRRMRQHTELKWSEVARQAFERRLKEIELAEKLLSRSRLTEKDAERIGHGVKAKVRKRFS